MEPPAATITAKSEREAMDWSLVLVSQGIGTTIERPEPEGPWFLRTDSWEHARAVEALRRYEIENCAPFWQQKLPGTGLIFDVRSLLWFLFLATLFTLCHVGYGRLLKVGIMDNRAVSAGAWWQLFTAITLHADLTHLLANTVTGSLLLGLAMGRFGPGIALLMAYLSGVAGNLAGWIWYTADHRGLGASGMIMGALGLITTQSVGLVRHGFRARQLVIPGIFGGVLLLVLLGMNPEPHIDVLAHVVGFATGAAGGIVLSFLPERIGRVQWINRAAELLCAGWIVWTWRLALR